MGRTQLVDSNLSQWAIDSMTFAPRRGSIFTIQGSKQTCPLLCTEKLPLNSQAAGSDPQQVPCSKDMQKHEGPHGEIRQGRPDNKNCCKFMEGRKQGMPKWSLKNFWRRRTLKDQQLTFRAQDSKRDVEKIAKGQEMSWAINKAELFQQKVCEHDGIALDLGSG